jgi:hypothetical protein
MRSASGGDPDWVMNLCGRMPNHPAFDGLIVEINAADLIADLDLARAIARRVRFRSSAQPATNWPATSPFRSTISGRNVSRLSGWTTSPLSRSRSIDVGAFASDESDFFQRLAQKFSHMCLAIDDTRDATFRRPNVGNFKPSSDRCFVIVPPTI